MSLAREFQDQITIMENEENYGFPKGCNVGIRHSAGEIIVLLNVDTIVLPGWLQALVETFNQDHTIGIVGSKIFFMDGKTLQYAGGGIRPNGLTYHDGCWRSWRSQI